MSPGGGEAAGRSTAGVCVRARCDTVAAAELLGGAPTVPSARASPILAKRLAGGSLSSLEDPHSREQELIDSRAGKEFEGEGGSSDDDAATLM